MSETVDLHPVLYPAVGERARQFRIGQAYERVGNVVEELADHYAEDRRLVASARWLAWSDQIIMPLEPKSWPVEKKGDAFSALQIPVELEHQGTNMEAQVVLGMFGDYFKELRDARDEAKVTSAMAGSSSRRAKLSLFDDDPTLRSLGIEFIADRVGGEVYIDKRRGGKFVRPYELKTLAQQRLEQIEAYPVDAGRISSIHYMLMTNGDNPQLLAGPGIIDNPYYKGVLGGDIAARLHALNPYNKLLGRERIHTATLLAKSRLTDATQGKIGRKILAKMIRLEIESDLAKTVIADKKARDIFQLIKRSACYQQAVGASASETVPA